jgi:hypothetical protein
MQTTIRPARIALVVVLGLLIMLVSTEFYHPVRVYLAHGEWCARFTPEGSKQILYGGKACGFKS